MAAKSVDYLSEFDADPNVILLIAHDPSPVDVLPFFPNGTINDWKAKDYKKKLHWRFLNEMPYEGKTWTTPLTDGVYDDQGTKLKDLPS